MMKYLIPGIKKSGLFWQSPAVAITLLLFTAIFSGCGTIEEGDPPSLNLDELIEQGKQALAKGDGTLAHEKFLTAQTIAPQNSEAAFGIVVSDLLILVSLADGVLDFLLDSLAVSGEGPQKSGETVSALSGAVEEGIGDTIQKYLSSIIDPVVSEMVDNLAICHSDSNFFFATDKVTIEFADEPLYVWNGNWDGDDLYWVDSIIRALQGLPYMVYSTNLNFDPRHFTAIDFDLEKVGLIGILDDLIEAFYLMFHDPRYPDFFGSTEYANSLMPIAGLDFGMIFHDFVDMQRSVENGWYDPADGIFSFEDINRNNRKDSNEPFTYNSVPWGSTLTELLPVLNAIAWNLRASFFDGSPLDVDPKHPNYWDIADLNMLVEHLTGIGIPLIPEYEIDFGGYFSDPDPTDLKNWISNLTYCLHNERGVVDILGCLLQMVESGKNQ